MPYTLELIGWRAGLKKVSFTQQIQADVGASLSQAKEMTDRLVAGETITLCFDSQEKRDRFRVAAEALGVVCRCADTDADSTLDR
jgi:hypothetical protein